MASVADARVKWALAGLDALKIAGEDWLGEAQRRAPVEEGTLRGSGELGYVINDRLIEGPNAYTAARSLVTQLARRGELKTIAVQVAFNTIYAARQHEELSWDHPLGGQAKYAESVLLERGPRYVAAAQRAMAGAF
jgi:hypothetical protein